MSCKMEEKFEGDDTRRDLAVALEGSAVEAGTPESYVCKAEAKEAAAIWANPCRTSRSLYL